MTLSYSTRQILSKYSFIVQDIDEFEPIVKNEPKFLIYKKTEMFDIIGKIEISDLDKNAQFEYRIKSDFVAIRENGDVILKAGFYSLD